MERKNFKKQLEEKKDIKFEIFRVSSWLTPKGREYKLTPISEFVLCNLTIPEAIAISRKISSTDNYICQIENM